MYTVRMLPIGAPMAVTISMTGHGLAVVLSILGLLLVLLTIRQIRRVVEPTKDPRA